MIRRPNAFGTFGPSQRGAVLAETAIIAAAMLTFMLGMVELGVIGTEQLTLDAAGFLNAHQNVVGVKDVNGVNDATSQVFPNVKPSSYLGATIQVAPSPTVPVDYGYNGSSSEQANASTSHVGGASLVQPYILQTNLKQKLFTFLGVNVSAASTATEPEFLETNLDYGVSNLNYGQSNASALYRSNLFTNGEETPQFFATWANIQACDNAPPWQTQTCVNSSAYQDPISNFPAAYGPREDSMGMGAFLDTNNWYYGGSGNAGLGISGPVCTSATSCPGTGPFEPAACHQRFYSAIASFVALNPERHRDCI